MQKVINAIVIFSGVTSIALIGGSTYLLLNLEPLVEGAKKEAIKTVTESITKELPGLVEGAIPSMPGSTGDVLNAKPAIPGI